MLNDRRSGPKAGPATGARHARGPALLAKSAETPPGKGESGARRMLHGLTRAMGAIETPGFRPFRADSAPFPPASEANSGRLKAKRCQER
jgi:hypothetical protein